MRPDSYSARGEWAIAIAMVVGVAVALLLFFKIQEAGATQSSSHHSAPAKTAPGFRWQMGE